MAAKGTEEIRANESSVIEQEGAQPQHLETGSSFKSSWKSKPKEWRMRAVSGAVALALVVAVPLAALAGTDGNSDSLVVADLEESQQEVEIQENATDDAQEAEAVDVSESAPGGGLLADDPDAEAVTDNTQEENADNVLEEGAESNEEAGALEGQDAAEGAMGAQSANPYQYTMHWHASSTGTPGDYRIDTAFDTPIPTINDGSGFGTIGIGGTDEIQRVVSLPAKIGDPANGGISKGEAEAFNLLGLKPNQFVYYPAKSSSNMYVNQQFYPEGGSSISSVGGQSIESPTLYTDDPRSQELLNMLLTMDLMSESEVSEYLYDTHWYTYWNYESYSVWFMFGDENSHAGWATDLRWTDISESQTGTISKKLQWSPSLGQLTDMFQNQAVWKTAAVGGYTYDPSKKYWELTQGVNNKSVELRPYLSVTYSANGGNPSGDMTDEVVITGTAGAGVFYTKPASAVVAPEGYRFVGWSKYSNATKANIDADMTNYSGTNIAGRSSVTAGEPLYFTTNNNTIYAVYEEATAGVKLDPNSEAVGSGFPTSVWGDQPEADGDITVTLAGLDSGLTNSDGTKVLVGWSTTPQTGYIDGSLSNTTTLDSATIAAMDKGTINKADGSTVEAPILYAVWDDLVTVNYALSDDDAAAGNGILTLGGSTTTLSEKVARHATETRKTAVATPVAGKGKAFKSWSVDGVDVSYDSSIEGDLPTDDSVHEITYVANFRDESVTITLDYNGGIDNIGRTGTVTTTATAVAGTSTYKATVPVKADMSYMSDDSVEFVNWTSLNPVGSYDGPTIVFDNGVPDTLTANWDNAVAGKDVDVRLHYNIDDAAVTETLQATGNEGAQQLVLPTPGTTTKTVAGTTYKFVGWRETQKGSDGTVTTAADWSSSGSGCYEANNTYVFTKATDLYALWDKEVEVTYIVNVGSGTGGTLSGTGITNQGGGTYTGKVARVYGQPSSVTATAAANSGSAFIGWTTTAMNNSASPVTTAPTASKAPTTTEVTNNDTLTYYANFGVSITLNAGSGTIGDTDATRTAYVFDASSFDLPGVGAGSNDLHAASDEKVFLGWNDGADIPDSSLSPSTPGTLIQPGPVSASANKTYYAIWDTEITITFVITDSDFGNGNVFADYSTETTVEATANKMTSDALTITTVPPTISANAADGYTFEGWLEGSSTTPDSNLSITRSATDGWGDSRTYTASFDYDEPTVTYTIDLDYNGGADGTSATSGQYTNVVADSPQTLRTDLVKDDKVFLGWSKSDPADDDDYTPTLVANPFTPSASDFTDGTLTLHAVYDDAAVIKFASQVDGWGSFTIEVDPDAEFISVSGGVVTAAVHKATADAVVATPVAKSSPAGYEFGGWQSTANATEDGATHALTIGSYTAGETTYTANFGYRNTFDYNGGADASDSNKTSEKSELITTDAATDVTFPALPGNIVNGTQTPVGWGATSSDTVNDRLTTTQQTTEPTTYYAIYDDAAVITYADPDANEGSVTAYGSGVNTASKTETVSVNAGTLGSATPTGFTVKANADNGYEFDHFTFTSESGSPVNIATGDAGVTEDGDEITYVPQPDGNGKYATGTVAAVFKKFEYTVVYALDDDNVATFDTPVDGETSFTVHEDDAFPAFAGDDTASNPKHDFGWKFDYWTLDGENEYTLPNAVDSSVIAQMTDKTLTLKPHWTQREYTVSFSGTALQPTSRSGLHWGDDVLSATGFTVTSGGTLTDPESPDDADGYEFVGWYRTAELADSDLLASKGSSLLWSAIATNSSNVADETMGTASAVAIYAKFEPKDFDITFNAGENPDGVAAKGSAVETQLTYTQTDVAFGSPATLDTAAVNAFELEGYHIAGWATNLDRAKASIVDYQTDATGYAVDSSSNELWAVWEPNTYTITFTSGGGTGSMEDQELEYDADPTELNENEFANDGYRFSGWKIVGDTSGKTYADKEEVQNLTTGTAVTLEAQWVRTATITYDTNGAAEDVTLDPATSTVDRGSSESTFTPPTVSGVTRSGYTLKTPVAWNTQADGKGTSYAAGTEHNAQDITNDITLYLEWEEGMSNYRVVRYLQKIQADGTPDGYEKEVVAPEDAGDFVRQAQTNSTVTLGDIRDELSDPEGFEISTSNSSDSDSVTVVATSDDDDMPELAVYYDRVKKTVTYTFDNGPSGVAAPVAKDYVYGQKVTLESLPTSPQSGKTHEGAWVIETDGVTADSNDQFDMPAKDVSIKLTWDDIKVNVTFRIAAGEGVDTPTTGTANVGTAEVVYGNAVSSDQMGEVDTSGVNSAYYIVGWKMLDGDGNAVSGKSQVEPTTELLTDDVIYEAVVLKKNTVTWKPGAHGAFDEKTYHDIDTSSKPALLPTYAAPTDLAAKPGYTFKRWVFTPEIDTLEDDGTTVAITAGTTSYADKDGTGLPAVVNQNFVFTAEWEATDQILLLELDPDWTYSTTLTGANKFDEDGDSNNVSKTAATGTDVRLPAADEVTADYYTLIGWTGTVYDEVTGTFETKNYDKGEVIAMPAGAEDNSGAEPVYVTRLQPRYEEKKATITFEVEPTSFGTVSASSLTPEVLSGSDSTVTATPASPGFEFSKWQVWEEGENDGEGSWVDVSASTEGASTNDNEITVTKTVDGEDARFVDAKYRAVFERRAMEIVIEGEADEVSITNNFPQTDGVATVPYGTSIADFLTGKGTTFAAVVEATAEEGYDLSNPLWEVTVVPLADDGTYDEDNAGDPVKTNAPETTVANGKVVIRALTTAGDASLTFDKNNENATGSKTIEGTTGQNFTAADNDEFSYTGHHIDYWSYDEDGEQKAYIPGASEYADDWEDSDLAGEPYALPAGTGNVVYAHWAADTVTFVPDPNGGTASAEPGEELEDIEGVYGETVNVPGEGPSQAIEPPEPWLEFAGWSTNKNADPDDAVEAGGSLDVTEEGPTVPLYAIWKECVYTVSFNGNGAGGSMDPFTTTWTGNRTFQAKENGFNFYAYHTFKNWNTVKDPTTGNAGTTYEPGDSIVLTDPDVKELVLYAQWEDTARTYDVYFTDEDGAVVTAERAADDPDLSAFAPQLNKLATDEITVPTVTDEPGGLVFVGWALSGSLNTAGDGPASGSLVSVGTMTVLELIQTLYPSAQYEAPSDVDELTVHQLWRIDQAAGYDINFNSNAPGKLTLDGSDAGKAAVEVAGNAGDPYAQHISAFNANPQLEANKFSIFGYDFGGWATEEDGAAVYDDQEQLTTDLVSNTGTETEADLFATWKAREGFKVNFYVGDDLIGTAEDVRFDGTFSQEGTVHVPVGQEFEGWYTQEGAQGTRVNVGTDKFGAIVNAGDVTWDDPDDKTTLNLYANITGDIRTYSIEFNSDAPVKLVLGGASTEREAVTVDDDTDPYYQDEVDFIDSTRPETERQQLVANKFSTLGYDFDGWATEEGGSASLDDEAVIASDLVDPDGEDDTAKLFATWKAKQGFKVAFYQGDTLLGTADDIAFDGTFSQEGDVDVPTGKQFGGWYTAESGGKKVNVGTDKFGAIANDSTVEWEDPDTKTTIKLHALVGDHMVTYVPDLNGGSGTAPENIEGMFGGQVSVPDDSGDFQAPNAWQELAGWSTDANAAPGAASVVAPGELKDVTEEGPEVPLYAIWKDSAYTLTYEGNGAAGAMDDQQATWVEGEGATFTAADNGFDHYPYHEFTGWLGSDGNTYQPNDTVTVSDPSIKTFTLTAQWDESASEYSIEFNSNAPAKLVLGGGDAGKADVVVDGDAGDPYTQDNVKFIDADAPESQGQHLIANKFSVFGYDFAGWATEEGGAAVYDDADEITADLISNTANPLVASLFATWEAQEGFAVAFYNHEGTPIGTTENVSFDGTFAQSGTLNVPDGMQLVGWYTSLEDGVKVDVGTDVFGAVANEPTVQWVDPDEKTTIRLFAVVADHVVTYVPDLNGGSGTAPENIEGVFGGQVNVPDDSDDFQAPNAWQELAGWSTDPEAQPDATSVVSPGDLKDVTEEGPEVPLYAIWKSKTYTLRYEGNGAAGTMESETVLWADGTGVSFTAADNGFDEYPHHDFVGWLGSDGNTYQPGDEVAWDDPAVSEVVLTAQWLRDTGYTILFNSNAPDKQVIGGTDGKAEVTVDGDAGDPYSQEVEAFNLSPLPSLMANKFHINGYSFVGWATEPDGEAVYADGEQLTSDLVVKGSGTTTANLYAVWQAEEGLQVDFYNGTALVGSTADVVYDQPFNGPADPTVAAGQKFMGWYTAPTGGVKVSVGTDTFAAVANEPTATWDDPITKKTLNLYALIVDLNVVVTVDPNLGDDRDHGVKGATTNDDGTIGPLDPQDYNGTVGVPAISRPGYTLSGWLTEDENPVEPGSDSWPGIIADPQPDDEGNVPFTLKPVWAQNTSNISYVTDDGGTDKGEISLQLEGGARDWKEYDSEQLPSATGSPLGAIAQAKPGYHFVNWTVNYAGTLTPQASTLSAQSADAMVAQDTVSVYSTDEAIKPGRNADGVYPDGVVYTANFERNGDGLVTFDSNGGTGVVPSVSNTIGLDINLPEGGELSREHYTFGGWELPDGTIVQPGTPYTVPGDVTVKAHWVGDTHTISVVEPTGDDKHGGAHVNGDGKLTYGQPIPDGYIELTSDDGYELDHWHVVVRDGDGNVIREFDHEGALSELTVEGDMEFQPVWKAVAAATEPAPAKIIPASGANPLTKDPLAFWMLLLASVAIAAAAAMRTSAKKAAQHAKRR